MELFDPPELSTKRLLLRPIRPSDYLVIPHLFADDPVVTRYVAWKPMVDEQAGRRFAEAEGQAWKSGDDCRGWIAWHVQTNAAIGSAVARRQGSWGEFSYVVDRAYWNKGYGTEIARGILERACFDATLQEIKAVCDVDNVASRRVLEKAGMRCDETLPAHQRHNIEARPRDCVRYVADVRERP